MPALVAGIHVFFQACQASVDRIEQSEIRGIIRSRMSLRSIRATNCASSARAPSLPGSFAASAPTEPCHVAKRAAPLARRQADLKLFMALPAASLLAGAAAVHEQAAVARLRAGLGAAFPRIRGRSRQHRRAEHQRRKEQPGFHRCCAPADDATKPRHDSRSKRSPDEPKAKSGSILA